MKKLLILCTIVPLFLIGCVSASDIRTLQRASAQEIGNNLKPNDIKISGVDKSSIGGAKNINWKATTPDGTTYNCDAYYGSRDNIEVVCSRVRR